jgi:glycosyltransferase involved in cell wall biosynthesis
MISVILPTHNRLPVLRQVLAAYEQQRPLDLEFELIVVDDGSEDGTTAFLESLRPQRYRLRHTRQEPRGPAAARNAALTLAQGELVLITGDDIEPAPNLLAEHLAGHAGGDAGLAILGLTRWPQNFLLSGTMRHIDGVGAQQFSYLFFEDGATYDFRHFYTSNISVHRALLDREPEYFSTDFPAAAFEDAEFAHRLAFHGLRIVYRASAVGFHHHLYDVRSFFKRQERCGTMAALLFRKHPALKKWLGILELERKCLALAQRPASARACLDAFAAELGLWLERLLDLGLRFDAVDPPGIDGLLREIFALGYQSGLTKAFLGEDLARLVLAELFLSKVPDTVAALPAQLNAAACLEAFAALSRLRLASQDPTV